MDLNRECGAEEARGIVRWLRPEYQNPAGHVTASKGEQIETELANIPTAIKAPWPKLLPMQIAAVQAMLEELGEVTPEEIARHFARARVTNVQPLLKSLSITGRAEASADGRVNASFTPPLQRPADENRSVAILRVTHCKIRVAPQLRPSSLKPINGS